MVKKPNKTKTPSRKMTKEEFEAYNDALAKKVFMTTTELYLRQKAEEGK